MALEIYSVFSACISACSVCVAVAVALAVAASLRICGCHFGCSCVMNYTILALKQLPPKQKPNSNCKTYSQPPGRDKTENMAKSTRGMVGVGVGVGVGLELGAMSGERVCNRQLSTAVMPLNSTVANAFNLRLNFQFAFTLSAGSDKTPSQPSRIDQKHRGQPSQTMAIALRACVE